MRRRRTYVLNNDNILITFKDTYLSLLLFDKKKLIKLDIYVPIQEIFKTNISNRFLRTKLPFKFVF